MKEIDPLGIEDVKRLLETYMGTYMSARLHIALLAGLRQGEALGLRWQDVDFETGLLEVRNQIQKIDGKFDGYSEAWSKSTFEVKSIKELMKLTEEFE